MACHAMQQGTIYRFSLEVRVARDSAARVADIREAVTAAVGDNLRQGRLIFWLTSALGALALGLGCFGLYGVMSYAVAGRTAELGIHMALGAPQSRLFRMVFGESAVLIAAGPGGWVAVCYRGGANGFGNVVRREGGRSRARLPRDGRSCRGDSDRSVYSGAAGGACSAHDGLAIRIEHFRVSVHRRIQTHRLQERALSVP
jgi:hypothetical protein